MYRVKFLRVVEGIEPSALCHCGQAASAALYRQRATFPPMPVPLSRTRSSVAPLWSASASKENTPSPPSLRLAWIMAGDAPRDEPALQRRAPFKALSHFCNRWRGNWASCSRYPALPSITEEATAAASDRVSLLRFSLLSSLEMPR